MLSKTREAQLNKLESQIDNGGGGAWEYLCLVRKLKLQSRTEGNGEHVALAAMDCQCLDVAKIIGKLEAMLLEAKAFSVEAEKAYLTCEFLSILLL
ncbi:hypothetical protein RchiOBHm_Chr5g0051541 [Rosa chinensis]|uniref:Uncharacterized protein n=1 Tax=Rosa chinensis TaxID=74649 RepID=A0A2P6QFF5_ROSCH|nr:hypothetical protein RchiOBHm_Chr5g0051541 [Rosa chinensis]